MRLVIATSILTFMMAGLCVTQEPRSASPADIIAGINTASRPARPLPDIPSLLRTLEANQKGLEELKKNYIFNKDEQEDELDGDGRVKKSERAEYEVFYVGRSEITRTISRNGKPLDEKEQRKEQEDVEKEIREARERQAKREVRQAEGSKEKDEITINTFLKALKVKNVRREASRGRELLAFDFEPNPEFKPSSKPEELVQKLSGSVWVDEDAKQVVRLEAQLLKDVKFGGFLASLHKGAAVVFEQQRINDEVWMPSYLDANLGLRVLFKGKRQHVTTRYSNYRKFRVETAIKPIDPGTQQSEAAPK